MANRAAVRVIVLLALGDVACGAKHQQFAPPPGGAGVSSSRGAATRERSTTKPRGGSRLDCGPGGCLSLADEIARQCRDPGTTVTRAVNGRYTVVTAQTDPESFIHTSVSFVFDGRGTLVGRTTFVNEWGRRSREGIVPRGPAGAAVDACGAQTPR
jgi:hypothetical protein